MREFKAYWPLAERMIEQATKEQLAETPRILALQASQYARRHGELPLPDLQKLLTATQIDAEQLACCAMAPKRWSACWPR